MAPKKETSAKRKKATYGKRKATKHYENTHNNSTKRNNKDDEDYSGNEDEVDTTITKKTKTRVKESSAAIERDVESETPKTMKVSVGKFKEHRSIVPSSKEAGTKGKIVPMPAKAPKPRMIVPSSAHTEKTERMVPSSAASFNFPGDSDDDDDDVDEVPVNATEIVSSGVAKMESSKAKRKSASVKKKKHNIKKGTPTRAFINWNEEHGNAASIANEKHNVRVFVNNHLFSKVKFITKDSQLDYNGKMSFT